MATLPHHDPTVMKMPARDPELAALVSAWLTFEPSLPSGGESHYEADTRLKLLSFDEPLLAWHVVLLIAAATSDTRLLRQLGAGRLEDLLSHDPEQFIPMAIQEAVSNPHVREALLGVWLCRHDSSDALLDQLESAVPGFQRLAACGCEAEGA